MKILFLIESLNNLTARNLSQAIKNSQHQVDILPYFEGGTDQCAIIHHNGSPAICHQNTLYRPEDYDAALLWCWGTAALGRKYLRLLEDQGVAVLNSTYRTQITDSKNNITEQLHQQGVPTPKTLFFDANLKTPTYAELQQGLSPQANNPPYVFKPDYSTQGSGIAFITCDADLQQAIAQLKQQQSAFNQKFIVQEFIGAPGEPICHFRVLSIGDQVFPMAIKARAAKAMTVSNIAAGSSVELFPISHDQQLKQTALDAAKASGLNVAGIDLMVRTTNKQRDIVVLEVNDGPGTKTFDKQGFNASQAIADYFIQYAEQEYTKRTHVEKAPLHKVAAQAPLQYIHPQAQPSHITFQEERVRIRASAARRLPLSLQESIHGAP